MNRYYHGTRSALTMGEVIAPLANAPVLLTPKLDEAIETLHQYLCGEQPAPPPPADVASAVR